MYGHNMHPLIGDLSTLKDSELENKMNDLTRKYFMSQNPDVRTQIAAVIDSYKEELSNRKQAEWQRMMADRNKSLDKLINVN
jgi:hypothetical protein